MTAVATASLREASIVATVLVFMLGGCAKARVPIYASPSLSSGMLNSFTLLPIVDRRRDTSVDVDLEARIRAPIREILEGKQYAVDMPLTFRQGGQPSMEDLGEMELQELLTLGPPASRFLLLVYLEDLFSLYAGWVRNFEIELTATILDRGHSAMVWRDKCIVTDASGGLISGVIGATIARAAEAL